MNYACLYSKCLQDTDVSDSSIFWNFRPGGRQIFGRGGRGGATPPHPHAYSWIRHWWEVYQYVIEEMLGWLVE